MLRHSQAAESAMPLSPDDELGELIRWSLRRTLGGTDPSPECWNEILRRVHEERARRPAQGGGAALRALVPVVQAVVAGALVLTFAVGTNQDVVVPQRESHVPSTVARADPVTCQGYPEDTLCGCRQVRMEWEHLFSEGGNIPRLAESR
jgi:hypothetical protein